MAAAREDAIGRVPVLGFCHLHADRSAANPAQFCSVELTSGLGSVVLTSHAAGEPRSYVGENGSGHVVTLRLDLGSKDHLAMLVNP